MNRAALLASAGPYPWAFAAQRGRPQDFDGTGQVEQLEPVEHHEHHVTHHSMVAVVGVWQQCQT